MRAREGRSASLSALPLLLVTSLVAGCVSLSAADSQAPGGPEPGVAAAAEPQASLATRSPVPSERPAATQPALLPPSPAAAASLRPIEVVLDLSVPRALPAASETPGATSSRLQREGELPFETAAPTTLELPPDGPPPDGPPTDARSSGAVAPDASPVTSLTSPVDPTAEPIPPVGSALDRKMRRKLDRVLRTIVRNKRIAGLQAAVRLPDGEIWVGTAGSAEFEPERPIEDDTVFAIASVTKTFIAALILQLAEEGKLKLDEPFGAYAPDAPRGRNVTVRQLLSHTSGIYNYFEHPRYNKAAGEWLRLAPAGLGDRDHRWTYDEILGLLKQGYCKPGRCYHYSNTNYVILGRVAEAAGGAPLHEQLRERFFEPLGLEDTYYQPAEVPPADAAHGHWPSAGRGYVDHTREARVLPFMAAVSAADAAGAIASTARDLTTWADALYGGRLLSPASLREMTTFLLPGYYGLGTDVAVFAGHRAVGHRGGLRGFESSMWHLPGTGVSVALLSNHGNWYLSGVSTDVPLQRLVKAVLGDASGG